MGEEGVIEKLFDHLRAFACCINIDSEMYRGFSDKFKLVRTHEIIQFIDFIIELPESI